MATFAEEPPLGGGTSSGLLSSSLVAVGSPTEAEQLKAQEEARLTSPEAVRAREESQTKDSGLGAEAAEHADGEAYPALINDAAGGPRLSSGEQIAGLPSDFAVSASGGSGGREVREAVEPIAMQDASGARVPIDLGLSDHGGAFAPITALAPVLISKRLSQGASLADAGVSLTPVDESGAPLPGEGVIDGATVFYADTEVAAAGVTDVDTIVKPLTFGLEMQTSLRSDRAPAKLYFKVRLPEGAKLVEEPSGSVNVVSGEAKLAVIFAPSAQDAQGTAVPTSMSLDGDTLVVTVEHPAGAYAYPIMVDPRYEYYASEFTWDTQVNKNGVRATNWHFEANGSLITGLENEGGQGWTIKISGSHGEHELGDMVYTTKKESHVWDFASETAQHEGNTRVETLVKLEGSAGVEEKQTLPTEVSEPKWNNAQYCRLNEKCVTGVTPQMANSAVYESVASGAGTGTAGENVFRKAEVAIQQPGNPEVKFDTADETIEGRPNALYGTKTWLGPHSNALVKLTASDKGIGVEGWSTEHTNASGAWEALSEKSLMSEDLCEGIQCPSEAVTYVGYSSVLPDGEPKLGMDAWNALYDSHAKENEAEAERRHVVRVDSTPPHNIVLKGLPAEGTVTTGEYHLTAEATDGSGSTPSSGVKSIAFFVDGQPVGTPSGSCSLGPCTTTSNPWVLNTEEYAAGKHTLTVGATDNAENTATSETTFTVQPAATTKAGPGSVNLLSGRYTLEASDVSMGAGLTVDRSDDSRSPVANGVVGPFGPQWSFSRGGQESIDKLSNENVVLTSAGGARLIFVSNKKGGFEAPATDRNLTLSFEEPGGVKEYVLKNAAAGTSTSFREPSGGSGEIWMPSIQTGPVATDTITYSYETTTVEGQSVTRPTEALAPVPAGVSCSPKLERGCRALIFKYAEEATTKEGENESEWGLYKGRLKEVRFVAYEPTSKEMKEPTVAEYLYDKQGRLRAVWDPRISPALKTKYGYDGEGHVTALTPPDQESWAFTYGTTEGDLNTGRLLKVTRAPVSASLWNGHVPANTEAPKLTGSPKVGVRMAVSNGAWANSPIVYGYQWERCNSEGKECTPIAGATNPNYTPAEADELHTLVAEVTATNGGGSVTVSTAPSRLVSPLEVTEYSLPTKSYPWGIAKGPDENLWFTDLDTGKVGKITTSGTVTEYAAGLTPIAITTGSDKNLWATHLFTPKIGKITTSGSLTEYELPKESISWAIAAGPDNNLWFTNESLNKIGKITTSGGITEYGLPSGSAPYGIAAGSDGNLWFTDDKSGKIGKITTSGTITEYGLPSGSAPYAITSGPDSNLWFTIQKTNKVGKITTAGTVTEYSLPSGAGPQQITTGPDKNLWFTESGSKIAKITTSGAVTEYLLPAGSEPQGLVTGPDENLWVIEKGTSKIAKINVKPTVTEGEVRAALPGSTIEYHVPVSGTGAPYELGSKEVEAWSQKDDPTYATAIFPPDEPQAWPASGHKGASIDYLDSHGRMVNTANPSEGVTTGEYNEQNDATRTLSADNRATALKEGAKSAEVAKLLDTQSTYNSEGTELQGTLGPRHLVKLSNGKEVQARNHTVYSYDEGAPTEGGPYRLVTKVVQEAQTETEGEQDPRTTATSYSGQNNLGWKLRKPTSVTGDPSGLKITHTTFYDETTGNVIETRMPGAGSSNTPAGGYNYLAQYSKLTETCTPVSMKGPDGVAFDSSGNVWVADTGADRVDELSSTGKYITRFGAEGTGNGQFKEPRGIAIDKEGHVWVTDTGNNRVQEFSSTGSFVRAFGTEGTENGQFKKPVGIAINAEGDVWVGDSGSARIQEFSSTGTFIKKTSVLAYPEGIAIDAKGDVWFTGGTGTNAVWEYSSTGGTLIGEFGASGTGNSQFKEPVGITVTGEDVYVVDRGNSRVEEFKFTEKEGKMTGEYLRQWGNSGTGNGQFTKPQGLAVDQEGHVWVADAGNSRIQKFSATGEYLTQFSELTETCTPVSMKGPDGVAFDSSGNVWVADTGADRVDELSSTGKYITRFGTEGTGNGQFKEPRGIAIDKEGHVWVADTGNNRVQELSSTGSFIRAFGSEGTETGKFKKPEALAIDSSGNVWVADTENNRVQEFSSTGTYLRENTSLEVYKPDGVASDGKGDVWVSDVTFDAIVELSATAEVHGYFGVKAGTGNGEFKGPAGLFVSGEDIFVADRGNNRVQEFAVAEREGKVISEYVTQFGAAGTGNGQFKEPQGLALDKEGHPWVADSGDNRIQELSEEPSSAHATQAIYYTVAARVRYSACGEHREWANLPCRTQPAKQPETSGVPNLPVSTITYNMYDEPMSATSTVGSNTHTTTLTYDEADRLKSSEISSTVGKSMPTVTDKYSETTGAVIEQASSSQSIKSAYNALGQLTSYTDASGKTTTYEYEGEGKYAGEKEVDGRPRAINDGQGTETYTYNETTGMLSELAISGAGTFTASYDVEGNMLSEHYPDGMSATYAYNAGGEPTSLVYNKETHCTEGCEWFKDSVVPSIHAQWATQTSSLGNDTYTYDTVGRLTETTQTPTGKGCVTRRYAYDEDTNRTSLTAYPPNGKNECATESPSVEKHTYDEADRLTDTGVAYEPFGETAKMPATDAGGSELASTFYADSQLSEQKQGEGGKEQTVGYTLDPAHRTEEVISTGKIVATETLHYTGPAGTPAWTSEQSGQTTRMMSAMSGLTAIQHGTETPILQLSNLHGDIVGTAEDNEAASKLASTIAERTEYGVPATEAPPKYSWLGAHELPTELPSGVIAMGARSYVPQLGRFLQTDPVAGGSANAYAYTNGNPVNETDLTGQYVENNYVLGLGMEQNGIAIEAEAAREAAIRAEEERKAREAAIQAMFAARAAAELAEAEARNAWNAAAGYEGEEEWYEEEEGEEYEYASYHYGGDAEHAKGHAEAGLLFQPLEEGASPGGGEESSKQGARRDVAGGCPSTHDPCWKDVKGGHSRPSKGSSCRSGGKRDKHGRCEVGRGGSGPVSCSDAAAAAGGVLGGLAGGVSGPGGALVGGAAGSYAGSKVC